MKKFLFSLKSELLLSSPVTGHVFLLRAFPTNSARQEISNAALFCQPSTRLTPVKDGQGNIVHQGYIEQRHDSFSFSVTGSAVIDSSQPDYSPAPPYYRNPTPLTKLAGPLKEFFEANRIPGSIEEKALHWMHLLSIRFSYRKGITNTGTTAAEAFELNGGVCQDFANILLALLRGEGILCRYVTGLLAGEGHSHAWVEFNNGKEWISLDPTHNCFCNDDYLKLAHGMDFNACAVEKGVFKGEAQQTTVPKASMREI